MKPSKNKIQFNFNLASCCYDSVANIQFICAKKLINLLMKNFQEFQPSSILDLGTGTGYIPTMLLPIFPNSKFTVNDIAENMLQQVKQKLLSNNNNNFCYCLGDMEQINFEFHDLIISNMAFQWLTNLNCFIKKLYNNSNILAFSCLLAGTFKEWTNLFQQRSLPIPTYQYPTKSELITTILALHPKNYLFYTKNFSIEFTNISKFIKYLKNLGANTSSQKVTIKDLKLLLNLNDKFKTTYKIFFGIIRRQ